MFERFTDRARKVMALANQEAQRLNHEYIGTEHILLGLVKEGSGVGANVLRNLDVDLRKVRLEVEKLVKAGPEMVTMGKLPQTPRAKKVIEYAIEEARSLNHNYVGTEHLLLGLCREKEGLAAQILEEFGVTEQIVHDVYNLLGTKPKRTLTPSPEAVSLRRLMEKAITEQDFEKALEYRNQLDALTRKDREAKMKEDADDRAAEVLRKVACVLFSHYTGDVDAEATLDNLSELLENEW